MKAVIRVTGGPGKRCAVSSRANSAVSHARFVPIFATHIQKTLITLMPTKITAAITALGGYVPETKLTNADLEKMVDTNDEWIRSRTGIEERRILRGEGLGTSDLAVPVVRQIC